jgi:two-component system nitrogen regulation response regulator NtrX
MAGERILVVDDEPGVRAALVNILRDEGFEVVAADSGEAGLASAEREPYDAVLLDVWLPGIDGLETLQRLRERRPDAEVVMISGHGTIDTAVRATKLGAFDFVEKPLSLEKTLLVLRNALRQRRLEQRNRHLLEQLSRETEVLGRSAAAERLRREVGIAAGSPAPVLVCGEPGSGRESVARRIHSAGPACDRPFVEVPAGALDPAAAAAALFGRDGAPGRIALAAGGSLFLDGADRLAIELQRRLAEHLAADPAPPRLIATTTTADALEPSLVRYVDVVRIDVPALRERREDVALLAERFMGDLAREYARPPRRLSPGCLAALTAHDWPGNIREQRNLMERLLLLGRAEVVEAHDLPAGLGGARGPAEDLYREFGSLAEGLAAFERYYVARILAEEAFDRRAAARRLGLALGELEDRLAR